MNTTTNYKMGKKRYEKSILLLSLLFFAFQFISATLNTTNVFAQDGKVITGKVTDGSTGEPLPGVSVLVKGTTTGTVSDIDGNYSLNVPEGATLVYSFVGYLPEEVEVAEQSEINMMLILSLTELDEVVVVGYGVQKKKLSTGATVHVSDDEISQRHSLRIEQAIQGLTPGVQVTSNTGQPGENPKVRIRGVGTVGNSDPLYVIDGVPTEDIKYLSPSDVESVDVLKDAASAAIYGARAANGVILITTKKGKAGEFRVSYDGYYGVQNVVKNIDLLNGEEYMTIMNEANINGGVSAPYSEEQINTVGEGTNWMDYLFIKNSPTYSHTVSLNGGSEKSVYSSSVSYFNQYGVAGEPGKSQYERITGRFNSEHTIYKDRIKIGENLVYSHFTTRGIGINNVYGNSNIIRRFINASPTFQVYDESQPDGFGRSWAVNLEANPYAIMHYANFSRQKNDKILGNLFTEIKILKDLTFRSDFGIDLLYYYRNSYTPIYNLSPTDFSPSTSVEMRMNRDFTYNFENYLTYNKTLGKHNVTVLVGTTASKYNQFWVSGNKEDLTFDDFDHAILNNATRDSTQRTNGNRLERALLSNFARLNWDYNEKLLLSATLRRDGSSKFGSDNRYGYFPSVSAGWIASQEEFFTFSFIDFFKIRGSWGQNGNDKIGDFQSEALIRSLYRNYYFGNGVQYVGSSPLKIHNKKLKWETSEQLDFGFDARFLDHFSMNFDWYNKKTKDWLIIAPVADIAGNDPPTINGGEVENKGVELALGFDKVKGDFVFSIKANIAYNKNKVTAINNPEGVIHGQDDILYDQCDEVYRAEVGYPIGYFYGYKRLGIFQDTTEINNYTYTSPSGVVKKIQGDAVPGDIKFADLLEDGTITRDDRVMIGDPNPDYTFGFSFSAGYKGFDLSILFQGVAGNQILYSPRNYSQWYSNYTADAMNRWHGPGTSYTYPRITSKNSKNFLYVSDLFVYDGSYVKLRNINIGYDFKRSLLKKLPVGKFRLYFSGSNLFTITKYPGLDPEVGYGDYDVNRYENFSTGLDIGYYPIPKSYIFGLNVEF